MEVLLSRSISRLAPRAQRRLPLHRTYWSTLSSQLAHDRRHFAKSSRRHITERPDKLDPHTTDHRSDSSHSQPAASLSHNISSEEQSHFVRVEQESKEKQRVSPWTRHTADVPPAEKDGSAEAMAKGKLLTTPSRMLKFIIPLRPNDKLSKKGIEPLALLVHPQQPLSYLERLVQSELPAREDGKPPHVIFRAEDAADEPGRDPEKEYDPADEEEIDIDELSAEHKTKIGGKLMRTGKLNSSGKVEPAGPKPDDAPQDPRHPNFVRWSPSTEIGDFIRDAARAKEFALDIENAGTIYVGVPSFEDRTYYLRMRLRKTANRILQLADLKRECDKLAHRGAKRVARLGFAGLITWWGAVYYFTFRTDLGWDVMEPVTYLVGLSSLIGGYMWFLYHNREVSYKSAMNFTVSRRQSQLYDQKGFEIQKWEFLVEEGNRLRREIKMIAEEYDVEWDETQDEGDKRVAQALREERKKEKSRKEKDDDDDDGPDDEPEDKPTESKK